MAKGPCVKDLALRIGELGIEGVSEMQLGTLVNSAMSEAHVKGIVDPKARENYVSSRVYDQVVAEKLQSRDSELVALDRHDRATLHIARNHEGKTKRGLKSLVVGTVNDRDSVGLAQQTAMQNALGELQVGIQEAGVLEAFVHADEALTREIFSRKKSGISKDAMLIRNELERLEDKRYIRIKMEGVDIERLPNRITRQHHDPYLMMNARKVLGDTESPTDKAAWVKFQMGILDHEATFSSLPEGVMPEDILEDMYENFVVGRNNVLSETVSEPDVTNPLAGERKLHYTPDGEVDQMLKFGAGSLAETVFTEISRYGKHLGLLQKLGPKPHSTLRAIVQDLRNMDPTDTALQSYTRGFDSGQMNTPIGRDFAEISGLNDMVVGTRAHEVGSWLQTFEFITKLGNSMPAAIGDVGGMAAELNYQQGNPIGALAQSMGSVIDGISAPADKRRVAEAIGIGVESMLNDHSSRLGGSISPSGTRTKILNATFKLNLLGPWTNSVRRGLFFANSSYMASIMRDVDSINPRMRALLGAYGVSDVDLKILSKELDLVSVEGGGELFDVTLIEAIPTSKFGKGEDGLRARQDLQRKMTSFFLDRNDFGVYTPDASVRSIVHRGLPKGDPLRVIFDLMSQFKQYGIGMVYRPLANSLMGPGQTKTSGAVTLATHIAYLLPLGAVITHMKDFAKGREQFIPETKEEYSMYFSKAMLQSGAYGIYGDVILGGSDSIGQTALHLAGPTANDALELGEVVGEGVKALRGKPNTLGATTYQSFRNDIPLADIFWLKTPLDYGIMYGIAEALDSGFAEKYEKRIEDQRMGRGLMVPIRGNAIGVN